MAAISYTLVCVAAIFLQTVTSQCIGPIPGIEDFAIGNGLAYGGSPIAPQLQYGVPVLSNPYGFAPASGGSFAVTSSSPIAPTGIRVISDNAIEGAISILGELPFLGSVAFESALPTAGAGAINYGCGNGIVGISSENIVPVGPAYPMGVAPGRYGYPGGLPAAGVVANAGLVGPGVFNGLNGINGLNGVNGFNGINGLNGINGFNGLNGLPGCGYGPAY